MFFFVEADGFKKLQDSVNKSNNGSYDQEKGRTSASVRRPYRGIQIKEDTYAMLSIRRADGSAIPLTSSSAIKKTEGSDIGRVDNYSDFILRSVTDQRVEKQQIIETFGEYFVYFFGEKPRTLSLSGALINTEDFNWRSQFWKNYDEHLRGTKLVESNARCFLTYDTMVIEGYPLSAAATDNAENPYEIPFQMTLLVTGYYDYSHIGNMLFPRKKGQEAEPASTTGDIYESTTKEVRDLNLNAKGPSGFLSALRQGMRAVNDFTTLVSNAVSLVDRTLSGRTLRLPLGVAGFVAQTGLGELSPTSVDSTVRTSADYLNNINLTVGGVDFEAVLGGKIKIGGRVKFSDPWVSSVTEGTQGYIFENYDEYVNTFDYDILRSEADDLFDSQEILEKKADLQNKFVDLYKEANNGSLLGSLAAAVGATRSAFTMIMSVGNFIADPLSTIGIDQGSVSRLTGVLKNPKKAFLGSGVVRTFKNLEERVANTKVKELFSSGQKDDGAASIGDVYNSNTYTSSIQKGRKNYESVYGDNDYTPLVKSNSTAQQSLDAAYGNTDLSSTDVQAASIDSVYNSTNTIKSQKLTAEERAKLIADAYDNTSGTATTDTSGITAADEADAQIDPIV